MPLTLIANAQQNKNKTAIVATEGVFTYQDLLHHSHQVATLLLGGKADLQEERIAFIVPSGFNYVAIQWGIWRSGGIAVPLCTAHPQPELEYVIDDTQATIIITHPDYEAKVTTIALARGCRLISTTEIFQNETQALPEIKSGRRALILYTSGTTGKPKGVVITHRNIEAQVTSLIDAWGWNQDDRILHVLPLHHIHGIINVLTCALWIGAQCHMLPKFDAQTVWNKFRAEELTLFMAVPTIYVKLITFWEKSSPQLQAQMSNACQKMRLMVSGSAALPISVLEKWQHITGHFLLERYGMTEIGMALSNPLTGKRLAGFVGKPLPQVEVRLVDENNVLVTPGVSGEIQVKGVNIFKEYWQNQQATRKAFQDDWFCTGDLAVLEDGNYRILGRLSVDIIKTGGYKVSALEIEEVLRNHSQIKDCAVVGIPDAEWGEKVSAALIIEEDSDLTLEKLRNWGKERLATYKVPSRILTVEDLPRNAMGKVTKTKVKELFMK